MVGGQRLPLKATVDSAVKDTAVEVILVAARTQTEVTMIPGRDLSLEEVKFQTITVYQSIQSSFNIQ